MDALEYYEGSQKKTKVTVKGIAGVKKWADSYFPPEDRVRLVRLVSHEELPGERSGESTSEIS